MRQCPHTLQVPSYLRMPVTRRDGILRYCLLLFVKIDSPHWLALQHQRKPACAYSPREDGQPEKSVAAINGD